MMLRPQHVYRMPRMTTGPQTPAEYLGLLAMVLDARGHNQSRWACPGVVVGYVNHGRWLVRCPHCRNAPSLDPEWRLALCFSCGAVFEHVIVPARGEIDAIERFLAPRPIYAQNWKPGETIVDLIADNEAHRSALRPGV